MTLEELDRREVRAALLRRLGEVAEKIERLLAGQDVDLSDMKLPQEADELPEPPLERVRRFMRLLQAALARLDRGEAGSCLRCGSPLGALELRETPWADTCRSCAGGASAA